MNKTRRAEISQIVEDLEELNCRVNDLKDEEQEAFDNLPEAIQYSERGESMEAAVNALEEVATNLEEALGNLETAAE